MSFRRRANSLNPSTQGQPITGQRIDGRTGESRQFGIRNAHRDGSGEIIGGVTADGTPFGTKSRLGTPASPPAPAVPAEAPQANAPAPAMAAAPATAPAQTLPTNTFGMKDRPPAFAPRPAVVKAAPAGSQLLKDRENLYGEMKAAGKGAITPEMETRGKQLGVAAPAWRKAISSMPMAPAAIAAQPPATAMPARPAATPAVPMPAPVPPAASGPAPAIPGPPQFGKDIARKNIAEKGTMGAIADFQRRNAVDQVTTNARGIASPPQKTQPAQPVAIGPSPSWKAAKDAVMPVTNKASAAVSTAASTVATGVRQAANVAGDIARKAPGYLKTLPMAPAPATAPARPATAPAPSMSARFVGNEPPTKQESPADRSKRMQEAKRKNARKFTDESPSWRGTAFGKTMDWLSVPRI